MNLRGLFDLSPAEKLQLVEDLWDDLASTPSDIPFPEWQKEELERRKANLQGQVPETLTIEELKNRIRNRYAR
jgi:putative addiction module component (TIGR02574 family)